MIQTAMAANSEESARRVPLIAAIPKMFFPFLVILPGLIAIGTPMVTQHVMGTAAPVGLTATTAGSESLSAGRGLIPAKVDPVTGKVMLDTHGQPVLDYDLAIPNMLLHYFPTGILGLGLTALLASFMSGMAGNVTAFNTVWTFDIYQSYIHKDASDAHYLKMGRWTTVVGIVISMATAYVVLSFNNIMDTLQLVFSHRERAAVCDVPAGHVLEAVHGACGVYWAGQRHRWAQCCTTDSPSAWATIPEFTGAGCTWSIPIRATWR